MGYLGNAWPSPGQMDLSAGWVGYLGNAWPSPGQMDLSAGWVGYLGNAWPSPGQMDISAGWVGYLGNAWPSPGQMGDGSADGGLPWLRLSAVYLSVSLLLPPCCTLMSSDCPSQDFWTRYAKFELDNEVSLCTCLHMPIPPGLLPTIQSLRLCSQCHPGDLPT